jgi:hypothetical protein
MNLVEAKQEAQYWLDEIGQDDDLFSSTKIERWKEQIEECTTLVELFDVIMDIPNDYGIDSPNFFINLETQIEENNARALEEHEENDGDQSNNQESEDEDDETESD